MLIYLEMCSIHRPLDDKAQVGAAATIRFINQFTMGHGNYTSERDALFAEETLDRIIADIKTARPQEGDVSNIAAGEAGG
jgi:hypothetical protein